MADAGRGFEVERTAEGARVVVDGEVRATFVGNLDDPVEQAAFEEMLQELFGSRPTRPTRR